MAELVAVDAGDERTGIVQADLQVNEGEVIGLAGLEGSGQGSLLRALAGTARDSTGPRRRSEAATSLIDPPSAPPRPAISFLPGGRLEEGLLPGLTITEHIELAGNSARFVDWDAARERAAEAIDAFRIKGSPGLGRRSSFRAETSNDCCSPCCRRS